MGTLCERNGLLRGGYFHLFAAVFPGSLQAMPPVGSGPAVQKGQWPCVLTFGPSPALGRHPADDLPEPFLPSHWHEFPGCQGLHVIIPLDAQACPVALSRPSYAITLAPLSAFRSPGPCPGRIIHRPPCAPTPPPPPPGRFSGPGPPIPRQSACSCPPALAGAVAWSRGSAARLWPVATFQKSTLSLARSALSDTPTPGSGPAMSLRRRR
jgi:hypothetical protein